MAIPPGALPETLEITIEEAANQGAGIGVVWELGPAGTHFAEPVRVGLRYAESDLDTYDGFVMPPLRVATQRDGVWELTESIEAGDHEVAGLTTHFSPFAIVATPPPELVTIVDQHGTHFEAGGLQLETSAPVKLRSLVVGPSSVSYVLEGGLHSLPVRVDLRGLRPGAALNVYDGSYRDKQPLTVDAAGAAAYVQDLSGGVHGVWIQRGGGTVYVDAGCAGCGATGRDCARIGTWVQAPTGAGGTCLLDPAKPVAESVEIVSSDTVLDCRGVPIDLSAVQLGGPAVVIGADTANVTVQGCSITADDTAVLVGPRSTGGRVEASSLRTTELARPTVHALAATDVAIERSSVNGAEGVLLNVAQSATVKDNRIRAQRGVLALGSGRADVRDNSIDVVSFIALPLPRTGPIFISRVLARGVLLEANDSDVAGNTMRTIDEPTDDVHSVGILQDAGLAGNRITGNRVRSFDAGVVLGAFSGDVVTFNVLVDNGVALRDESPVAAPPLIPLRTRAFLNDFIGNGFGGPQVWAASNLELWDDNPASSTFGKGNFWGHPCGAGALFVAGSDTNTGDAQGAPVTVQDAAPYGLPVTSFASFPGQLPNPSGCTLVDLGGSVDTDGDNLTDAVEVLGVDVDGDGVIGPGDVDLPALGANPLIPDVFVEVDYSDHPAAKLDTASIDQVVGAFAAHGFHLHVDLGTAASGSRYDLDGGQAVAPPIDIINENGDVRDYIGPGGFRVGYIGVLRNALLTPGRESVFYYSFMALSGNDDYGFDLAVDAAPGDSEVIVRPRGGLPARGFAQYTGDRFEYQRVEAGRCCDPACSDVTCLALAGIPATGPDHQAISTPLVAGQAQGDVLGGGRSFAGVPGNTVALTFASHAWSPPFGMPLAKNYVALTFMHELGHNLGLCHGGSDSNNYKSNYISIMNYMFLELGIPNHRSCFEWLNGGTGEYRVDYSDNELRALDEQNLVDAEGIRDLQGVPYEGITQYRRFNQWNCVDAAANGGAIDWHQDGDRQPSTRQTIGDINDSCRVPSQITCPTPVAACDHEVLTGWNDWANISFDGVLGAAGPYPFEPPIDPRIFGSPVPGHLPVQVDLKPGSAVNPVNPGSLGVLPVSVLLPGTFVRPEDVDLATIAFGPTGTEAPATRCQPEDGNGDGFPDLLCHFATEATGLTEADDSALLRARTTDGIPMVGHTTVRIVPPHP